MQFVIARKTTVLRCNPLHAMEATDKCGSLSETQWIATGYALAMTKCGVNLCTVREQHTMSLRGENEVSDAAIHRVSRTRSDLSLRLRVHSGSPRATHSR